MAGFKKRLSEEKEGGATMIYNYMDENMPEWAKPIIQKLIDKGALKGNEKGALKWGIAFPKILLLITNLGFLTN
mgnify:FL=1